MRPALALLPLCAAIAACSTPSGSAGPAAPAPDDPGVKPIDAGPACRPEGLDAYVGKPATEAVLEELRTRSGARHLRVGKPGMAMTMDFRQDRLTLHVDADNRITSLSCG